VHGFPPAVTRPSTGKSRTCEHRRASMPSCRTATTRLAANGVGTKERGGAPTAIRLGRQGVALAMGRHGFRSGARAGPTIARQRTAPHGGQ